MAPLTFSERDDSGVALLIVIGAVALLVVLLTAAFYASSQTLFQSQMADQHDAAFQAASSGVLVAFTSLQSAGGTLPQTQTWTGSMPASSAVYSASVAMNAAQTAYDCTSTGTAPDGTREVVVASFSVTIGGKASELPWGNNVFYFAGYSGGALSGSPAINGPFYVIFPTSSGWPTFTLQTGSSQLTGGPISIQNGNLSIKSAPLSPMDFYTNGTISGNAAGSANIVNKGWDPAKAMPVTRVDVPSFLARSLANATAQSSDNKMGDTTTVNYEAVSVGDPSTYAASTLNPPNNRPTGWLRSKATGAASAYKVLNSGLTIDFSTKSFGSWSGDGHYPTTNDLHDDFAYDATNHTLYVEGTVYVNGDITINRDLVYAGNGTIVCTGNIYINASIVPATANAADGLPDPDARHLLGMFTPGNLTVGSTNVDVVAACYMVGVVDVTGTNCFLKGSFVAEQGCKNLKNNFTITAFPALGDYVSAGLPFWGSGGTASAGGIVMSAWRRL